MADEFLVRDRGLHNDNRNGNRIIDKIDKSVLHFRDISKRSISPQHLEQRTVAGHEFFRPNTGADTTASKGPALRGAHYACRLRAVRRDETPLFDHISGSWIADGLRQGMCVRS